MYIWQYLETVLIVMIGSMLLASGGWHGVVVSLQCIEAAPYNKELTCPKKGQSCRDLRNPSLE